jgi:hypothetical protein
MTKFATRLCLLFLFASCDTSTVFKTTLPYLQESLNAYPDEINGTFVVMEDSIHREMLTSGLSAPEFIEKSLNGDTTRFFHYAHMLTKDKKGSTLNYSLLMLMTDSMLNSGKFIKEEDSTYWEKIHNNIIEFRKKNYQSGNDTTLIVPFWKEGDLYLSNDFSPTDEISDNRYSTLSLKDRFTHTLPPDESSDRIAEIIIKKKGNSFYKIEQNDSLYSITEYSFTSDGFTETIIPDVIVPEDSTQALADSAKKVLEKIREVSHALLYDRKVVFDPQENELKSLFVSAWSVKRHYIRISEPIDKGKGVIRERYLIAFLGLLSLTLFILLLRNKPGKK